MNIIQKIITFTAFSFVVLGLPAIASAQYRDNGRNYPGGQQGPYGQYGQYGQYGNMRGVISNLKSRSKDFEKQLDRDLNRSRYRGTRLEDRMNDLAKDFRKAAGRLKTSNDRQDMNRVRDVLNLGAEIDRQVMRSGAANNSRHIWNAIRGDLQVLANAYGFSNRNTGYPGWGSGRGNNGRINLPSWWPF